MLPLERKEKIKDALRKNRTVTITALSSLLQVSTETIRRDLASLEGEGFLERTHGGATIHTRVIVTTPNQILRTMYVENKRRIAQEAAKFIHPNDCIFLDNSTTVFEICQFIRYLPLTVVTISLAVINYLSECENIQIISPGGDYNIASNAFEGVETLAFLQTRSFDKAFVSPRSVDIVKGLCDSSRMISEIRKNVIRSSTSTFLLADHTKINRSAFVTTCAITEINCLITDKELDESWKTLLDENNIQYVECHMEL